MKPLSSLETTTLEIVIIIVAAIGLSWIGPRIIMWLTRHVFVTTYQRTLPRKDLEKRHKTLGGLFANVWRIIVFVVAGYAIFIHFFDKSALTPLFASAGIIGVAFGFGAQSLVKDFLSGVFIISENQYRVGDIIEIDGFGGTVERIGVRSTVIRDVEGNVHFFPNGIVQHVTNKTMGYSKVYFTITVAPETSISQASEIINTIGEELSHEERWRRKVIEAPHFDMLGDFNASSISLVISGKTQPSDQWALTAEMRRRILREFDKADIELGAALPAAAKRK